MKLTLSGFLLIFTLLASSCATQEQLSPAETFPPESPDHSGMWLMSQLDSELYQLLNRRGLQLSVDEIYNPESASIHKAVVRINIGEEGGGTGSFVSDRGLILTNHHVAYDAIASAAGREENFLENGFYAESIEDEVPVPGYSVHIPIEQIDVTDEIQKRLSDNLTFQEMLSEQEEIKQQIIDEYVGENPDLTAEVVDLFGGNRQLLSSYRVIRDIRLVYAPEESIGKFGGDVDNWMWPRHTGDYTFFRAYVDENGSSTEYQPQNVPFQPDYSLPIRNSVLNTGDFTMTLGFPGSTYRKESSYAFDFYEKRQFPVLQKAFRAYLNGLEKAPANELNTAEKASIANTLKYYEGIRDGFDNHNVTNQKRNFDQRFDEWVSADSLREIKYGRVLPQLEQSYSIADQTGDVLYLTFYALQFSTVLQSSSLFDDFYEVEDGESIELSEEEKLMTYDYFRQLHQSYNHEAEYTILKDFLYAFAELPEERRPLIFYRFFDETETSQLKVELERFLNRRFNSSILTDTASARNLIFSEYEAVQNQVPDSLYLIADDVRKMFEQSRDNYLRHFTYLLPAQKRYVEGILEMDPGKIHPADANFTLRLSAGEIMGYQPEDGVYNLPFTTLRGMIQKNRNRYPFLVPDKLLEYAPDSTSAEDFSGYGNYSGELPLNFLSTNDITGGNSGSPVLNANGEIIGLAFDGNIEGIVSDYFFIPELTRTISVDIKFILFMMEEIDNTDRLLDELQIRSN
ncbi:S46 family peptidase [Rhodohalobacter sp.]|uniref:S46 family peptidase n=1 Tax=Rhodohalobacter sp. TaxID=1974210 RepID=UPI002ACE4E53|nr:S46 family peptidase [Rhodohalobacter sp.]MDZ7758459.1 S46 family peptidase [Rhodohalobacter sp.]